jgi:hypothetical protein
VNESIDQPPAEDLFREEDFSMEGYDKHIRNARIMLFVLAGLTFLSIWTLVPFGDDPAKVFIAVFVAVVGGIFVALAFWTKKKPFTAILLALIIYVALEILAAFAQPATIFQGWIIKIAIVVMLIMGLQNARESQNMMEAYGKKR